jgi:hypothetical protein
MQDANDIKIDVFNHFIPPAYLDLLKNLLFQRRGLDETKTALGAMRPPVRGKF